MPRYNVHLYREMRTYFPGIEADSPRAAAAIADGLHTSEAAIIEDCEGKTLSGLVDLEGDLDYAHSLLIDFDHLQAAAPLLLAALKDLLSPGVPDIPTSNACRHCGRLYPAAEMPPDRLCPADECPGHRARAAVAAAEPDDVTESKEMPCS